MGEKQQHRSFDEVFYSSYIGERSPSEQHCVKEAVKQDYSGSAADMLWAAFYAVRGLVTGQNPLAAAGKGFHNRVEQQYNRCMKPTP